LSRWVEHLLRWHGSRLTTAFDHACHDPGATQRALLLSFLRANRDTAFGRDHAFARCSDEADFRRAVPIRDYEQLRGYVDRIIAGERRVLTEQTPLMFNTTSGTTAKPKLIPLTEEYEQTKSRLTRQWFVRAAHDHPGLFSGKALYIVSPAVEGYAGAIPFGSATGRMYGRLPWLLQRACAVPYEVFTVGDYDARYFLMLRFALEQQVSIALTPNPSTLLRLAEIAQARAQDLIRAIHDGTLGIEVAGEQRRSLGRALSPNPKRAGWLEQLLRADQFLPRHFWPQLKMLGCWTGGSAGTAVRRLGAYYGDVPVRDPGLIASEAHMTLPLHDGTATGVLAVDTNYYELIAEADIDAPQPTIHTVETLREGQRYYILLTTASGLYRYDINDIVEVTGFHHRTPMVAFVRKGRDMANITGEKMHVNHCLQAMQQVERDHGLSLRQFKFVARTHQSHYEAQVEHGLVGVASTQSLADAIDLALCEINCEYQQKRKSGRLTRVVVRSMPTGWADGELRRHVLAGKRVTQFKWKYLEVDTAA
jgi:hypothetical protein